MLSCKPSSFGGMYARGSPLPRHGGGRQRLSAEHSRHSTARGCPQRITCEFAGGRSAWPLQRGVSNILHRVEQVFHSAGDAIRTSPPTRLLNGAYQPAKQEVDRQFRRFAYVYADFTSEETKRKWKWSQQMSQEAKLWKTIVVFLQVLAATMLWEALTPVSVVWGLVLPLVVNWVVYDRLIMNPIMVGLMLVLPYKFFPGVTFRWL